MSRTYNHVRRPAPKQLIMQDVEPPESAARQALMMIDEFEKPMVRNTTIHLGYGRQETEWHYTVSTKKYLHIDKAADFVAKNWYRIPDVVAVRISIGAQQLGEVPLSKCSTLVWWSTGPLNPHWSSTTGAPKIHMPSTIGEEWKNVISIQFISQRDTTRSKIW